MSRVLRLFLLALAGFLVLRYIARLLTRSAAGTSGDSRVKGRPRAGGPSIPADRITDAEFKDIPKQ